ncbi:MAG TPA: LacI family DNA-binding transcriptional regulator [Actinomycetes bacterium]
MGKGEGQRVTLQSIADLVGVSRTTVSNAYGRPDQLNPKLRERILAVAEELGYCGPDPAGRTLRSGHAGAVGVLLGERLSYAFTDPAAMRFLEGVGQVGDRAGVGLLLLPATTPAGGGPSAGAVQAAVADGFLVYSMPDEAAAVRAVAARRLPTVVVDEPRLPGASFVGIDDRAAARGAAEHLLGLGHRRFGVITFRTTADGYDGPVGPERQAAATYSVTRDRLGGYADALRAAGLRWEDVPVEERASNSPAGGADAARALLERPSRPTAILATSDVLAIGAMRAVARARLPVPEAVSVVGFDDTPDAALVTPALTSVRQPLLDKGTVAGRLLLDPSPGTRAEEVLLPTELAVRASTGPPP